MKHYSKKATSNTLRPSPTASPNKQPASQLNTPLYPNTYQIAAPRLPYTFPTPTKPSWPSRIRIRIRTRPSSRPPRLLYITTVTSSHNTTGAYFTENTSRLTRLRVPRPRSTFLPTCFMHASWLVVASRRVKILVLGGRAGYLEASACA